MSMEVKSHKENNSMISELVQNNMKTMSRKKTAEETSTNKLKPWRDQPLHFQTKIDSINTHTERESSPLNIVLQPVEVST
jgi:hypothetical protein